LCKNCARLIENDLARFSVEVLKRWKADAEAEAKARAGTIAATSDSDLFMDVAVMNEDASSWGRGDGNRTAGRKRSS
jgi:hypothetical protein